MANPLIPYTFVADEEAVADEVNENFESLRHFLATQVVHRDASQAFTQVPSGPEANPTSNNQFTRKLYVDTKASEVAEAAVKDRLKYGGTSTPLQGILPASWEPVIKFGRNAGTTNSAGGIRVNYPTPFPNGTFTILTQSNYFSDADLVAVRTIGGMNDDGFDLIYSLPKYPRSPYGNRHVDFSWLAVGF